MFFWVAFIWTPSLLFVFLKNIATVSCHPQTGVQSKYKFYICQHICKLNVKMAVLNFTQWNSKSTKINIKCFDTVRWLPGAFRYEFLIIKDIFKKHNLWCNMSLKLPNSDIGLCRVKFLMLDRFEWLNAWIFLSHGLCKHLIQTFGSGQVEDPWTWSLSKKLWHLCICLGWIDPQLSTVLNKTKCQLWKTVFVFHTQCVEKYLIKSWPC